MSSKKKYAAITYGWRNLDNGKMYIGYHKTNNVYDGYIFSSEDEEANLAWSYGRLKHSIIYRGKQSTAITLENFLLKSVRANRNPQFYNKSVGGGVGCVSDFSNLTDAIKKVGLDWIQGIDPVEKTKKSKIDIETIELLVKNIKEGKYFIHPKEKVAEIVKLPRNQVRMNIIEHEHKDEIVERMTDDPASARKNISPVIVLVYDDGRKEIIDGNHTIDASNDAGWLEVPVIYISASEFKYKQQNIDYFGYMMNHDDRIKKQNSKNDLKMSIIRFTESHKNLTIGTEEFKEAYVHAYGKFWSKKSISNCIDSVKKHLETLQEIKNSNFKVYSHKELSNIVEEYEKKNPGVAVISITSGSCYNAGIGAVMNKAGGLNCWEGIMIVSHKNIDDLRKYNSAIGTDTKSSKDKLQSAMKRVHPNMKIQVVELPCYVNKKDE